MNVYPKQDNSCMFRLATCWALTAYGKVADKPASGVLYVILKDWFWCAAPPWSNMQPCYACTL